MTISQRYIDEQQFMQLLMEYEDRNHLVIEGNIREVEKIIYEYKYLREQFSKLRNRKELDSFENYSCLLIAVSKSNLMNDRQKNIELGLDIVLKLCEEPYSVTIKDSWEVLATIEKVDYDESFVNEMETFKLYKDTLVESILLGQSINDNIDLKLRIIYQSALKRKHENSKRISLKNN